METKDFVFSPIRPEKRVGDSGNLLLARHRRDRSERYLVKHEYCDCPCNEFVYAKLAGGMGLRIPESKLFHISEEDKRRISAMGYGVGARYGEESRKGFLRPFYGIQELTANYIDDFLNTLCYFYPDFIGDCYKRFICAAQEKARELLNQII